MAFQKLYFLVLITICNSTSTFYIGSKCVKKLGLLGSIDLSHIYTFISFILFLSICGDLDGKSAAKSLKLDVFHAENTLECEIYLKVSSKI